MKLLCCWIVIIILAFMLAEKYAVAGVQTSAHPLPFPLEETRYCGEPPRDAAGKIKRSSAVIAAFYKYHACPSTKKHVPPCPGWSIDHPIPMSKGGCDAVSNMQWLPYELKTNRAVNCKDCFELMIYDLPYSKVP